PQIRGIPTSSTRHRRCSPGPHPVRREEMRSDRAAEACLATTEPPDGGASRVRGPGRQERSLVASLPPATLPRERLLDAGTAQLSEVELLAIVLGSAGRIPAMRAAEDLLARHGSLPELARLAPAELARAGVGPVRAARLAASLELGRR